MPSAEVKAGTDLSALCPQEPFASPVPPHRKLGGILGVCGQERPQEFRQLRSPQLPSPHGESGGGVSSLLSLLALWDPQTRHTWSPPIYLHFKENLLHMFPIHLHFNSPEWGREQSALPLSPHPQRGTGEHVSPSGTGSSYSPAT